MSKKLKQLKINQKLKKKLFGEKFFYPCYYCKYIFLYKDLTVEHLIPLSIGGTNNEKNITLACSKCNHNQGKISFQKSKEKRILQDGRVDWRTT